MLRPVIAFIHGRMPVLWLAGLLALPAAGVSSATAPPPWVVRTWQSDVGLPDNTVVGIGQTPDGFLWVATSTGLARFDGVQFRSFPVTVPGAPAGRIKNLLADRRNRLWIAKEHGLVVCVDQGRTTMVVGPEHAAADIEYRRGMVEDAAGAVWVTYGNGEVLRIEHGQVRSFTAADGLPDGGFCHLVKDGVGRLWFSKGGWVGVFRDGKFHPLLEVTAVHITGARAGGIWGCSGRQLWKYTEGGFLVGLGALPADPPGMTVTTLHEDRAGCLWLGTREVGLFRFDRNGVVSATLSQQTILTMTSDREGNLWVGTRGGGLSQLTPKAVELLSIGSAAPFTPVGSVCQDSDGVLWAVVWPNGKVLRSAGQDWTPLSAKDGWPGHAAQCVSADPQGGVWIGTQYNGLHRWHNGVVTDSLDKTRGLAGDHVDALLVTASGEVWIGTIGPDEERQVLQRWHAGKLRNFQLPTGSGLIRALASDAAGACWAATAKGLLVRVWEDALTNETGSTLAEPCEIRCLLGTPDGSLWIGYSGQGLGRLKAGRFSRCRMDQGLHDDSISNILPDGHGRLWFAGNRGIFSVLEQELDNFAQARVARVWSVAYGRNDGLLRLQASYDSWPGAARGTDGRLWFAMQSGIAAVNAGDLKENPEPPPVVIEQVSVNGKTVAAYGTQGFPEVAATSPPLELNHDAAHLHLAPGQRRVEFFFTAPAFTKPESIGFKYRLVGLDADWVAGAALRSATYAGLPPGHYRFEVRACNSAGVWNETGAALDLTVEPYWWETTWCRVLAPLGTVGLLAGGILLGLRRRHRRQIEHLELLQATDRERARIAADLHDDLGASLTEIGLLGALGLEPAIPLAQAQGYLAEVATKSREMVAALDEIVWAVNPVNDLMPSVASYLCYYAQRFVEATPIRCRLDVAADLSQVTLNSEQRHGLLLALKEALNNVVRHAAATEVWLRIHVREGCLRVTLEDNGHGFVGDIPAVGADGLANMRGRLAGMGGTCEVRSALGQGTTVEFALPVSP